MNHHANPDFWACYQALSPEVQQVADRAFQHLKRDQRHPSLQFKKVGPYWSARVGSRHRALATEASDGDAHEAARATTRTLDFSMTLIELLISSIPLLLVIVAAMVIIQKTGGFEQRAHRRRVEELLERIARAVERNKPS